jgi:hypothetical protein
VRWRRGGLVSDLHFLLLKGNRMARAVSTRAPWAVVLFVLLPSAASPLAAETCRQVNTSEFPVVGGRSGVWLSSSQVALEDLGEEARFLVYELNGDTVRSVVPEAKGYDSLRILDVVPVGDGFWMGSQSPNRFVEGSFVLRLDPNLKPISEVSVFSWPREWGNDVHFHGRGTGLPTRIDELEVTPDGFVAWLYFARDAKRDGAMRFTLPAGGRNARVTPVGFWRQMPTEAHPWMPLTPSRLAATGGENADAYALRVDEEPFIQRLSGSGDRLSVFPDWPGPMPDLPPVSAMAHYPAWWKAVEKSSFPVGLYAEGPHLYVLVRLAATGGPEWELHAIDPVAESLLHSVRLPTRAAHVSLVPGPKHWALIEGSSYFEDEFRKPKRLLLLDAEAIRSGEELSCS